LIAVPRSDGSWLSLASFNYSSLSLVNCSKVFKSTMLTLLAVAELCDAAFLYRFFSPFATALPFISRW
jgi:hypothetical protein